MAKRVWFFHHDATRMFEEEGGRHYWFSEKLQKRGYETIIFCSSINHHSGEERKMDGYYEIDEVNGIRFVFVKTTAYEGNGLSRIKNWFSFYLGLFKSYKAIITTCGEPDVILASSAPPLPFIAGIQIAKKLNIPCIGEVRDLWPEAIFTVGKTSENSMLGKLLHAGEYWMYRNADAVVFTKEGDTDHLREQGWLTEQGGKVDISKCHYINNGIDFGKYLEQIETKTLEDPDLEDGKFHVVYTGTLRLINNVRNIVEAAIVLKDNPDVEFLIYGEGVERAELEELARKENLTNIKFKGMVNKQYIPYILSKSSVNLLNYAQNLYNWKRGNSSNKMFEYLASGRPIISSVKMGYDIIERYGCGYSLEECTPECLAEMILKVKNMSQSEYEQMGIRAREASKQFDFEILTDKLEMVINTVEESHNER